MIGLADAKRGAWACRISCDVSGYAERTLAGLWSVFLVSHQWSMERHSHHFCYLVDAKRPEMVDVQTLEFGPVV